MSGVCLQEELAHRLYDPRTGRKEEAVVRAWNLEDLHVGEFPLDAGDGLDPKWRHVLLLPSAPLFTTLDVCAMQVDHGCRIDGECR
jgi:hypothetical protein